MRSLLLVIDLQNGWRHKTATEAAMLRTVKLCKQFDGDIIHCCFWNDPKSLFHTQLNWRHFVDPDETDQIPEIAALNLPVYWQSTYSRVNAETTPILKKYDHIYIAGVFTDISIACTAMNIFDLNIPVSVVIDCIATMHGEPVHLAALRSLNFAIGGKHMVQTEDIVNRPPVSNS